MFRASVVARKEEEVSLTTFPPELAGVERRVTALLGLLAQLDQRDQEAIISECFTRAETAQQLADLRQAVDELTAGEAQAKRA